MAVKLPNDEVHGEQTCKEGSLMLDDGSIDRMREWWAFHSDEKDKKATSG